MYEITLTEDNCLKEGKDFKKEKQFLLNQGYKISFEFFHPAIGKIVILKKENFSICTNKLPEHLK